MIRSELNTYPEEEIDVDRYMQMVVETGDYASFY